MSLHSPFHYGGLELANNIFYAPLSGYTDLPFRRIILPYRPGLFFCEMVKMEPLTYNQKKTMSYLDFTDDMHPIGAQLIGSNLSLAASSARILEDMGFDSIDLNCGCPVPKVVSDGSGAAMVKTPDLIGEVLAAMVGAVSIPVSVKIRAGWDNTHICVEELTRIAEQAGACAITIHGRTRKQGYTGKANWEWIRVAKEAAHSILVIGNGDVFSGHDAQQMLSTTSCDGILIGRGMLGNPWIAEDIINTFQGKEPQQRTLNDVRTTLLQHYSYMREYKNERQAVIEMRRIACWYFKKYPGAREFRRQITTAQTHDDVCTIVRGSATHSPR